MQVIRLRRVAVERVSGAKSFLLYINDYPPVCNVLKLSL